MLDLSGYRISEKIYESAGILVFRGYKVKEDRQPVIIKTLQAEIAEINDALKLVHEYEITRNLDIDGIMKPVRLERAGEIPAIILEDTGVVPLKQYLRMPCSHLPTIFAISLQLVETLGKLHQKGVIHRDLKPDSIFIDPGTIRVKITDFSTAILLSGEEQNAGVPDTLVGTPPYMSPEQTGRLNKTNDYRSDFYSLGVILYEMLTGKLHLQAEDPDQWAHAHIVQVPVPLQENNPAIPRIFTAIIMKLIAKNPEDRYQSANGLLWDIKECWRQWTLTGEITPFPLGRMDLPGRLIIPSKLYGRGKETEVLQGAFVQACSGQAGIVLVHGYAGVGKTALVSEIIKSLALEQGYFIYGKFDQLQSKVPHAPIMQAFGSLIRQLLTESRENLHTWRKRLLRALGGNGAVINEMIPEVKLILGPQPPVEALPPQEAQNRFRLVFRNFTRVFTQKKHPLVVFLDDLQWADPASLQLIRYLSDISQSGYLLLIGAYRDNEVTDAHPLTETLKEIQGTGVPVRYIPVEPLDIHDTVKYIADVLYSKEEKVHPLGEILYRKTAGNPFFLKQLLQVLYDEKYITFNIKDGCWEWEPTSLQKLEIPDNVVHFMTNKLKRLPEKTSYIIKIAACIGSTFDLKTLSIVCEMTVEQTVSGLQPAVQESLVLQKIDGEEEDLENIFEFLHDRIHQAAYALVAEVQKKELHLKIGRLLLQNTTEEKLEENISSIMDQLNRGIDLVKTENEKIRLAGYNLSAGRKAKDATAYDAALSYLKAGIELLPKNSWNEHYQLTYELYLECSQCEYLCGRLVEADRLFDVLLGHSRTDLEKARVYRMKMILNSGVGRYIEAVQHGMTALKQIGYNQPSKPGKMAFLKEIILFKWRMRGKRIEDLLYLPEMDKPVPKKALELMALLAPSANSVSPELYVLLCLKASNLSIKYGNSDLSSIGYAGYAILSINVLKDYVSGHEFEKLAVTLAEKYGSGPVKCMVYFIVGALVSHWTQPGKISIDYLEKAVKYGLACGELLYTGYALGVGTQHKYIIGVSLKEVDEECQSNYDFANQISHNNLAVDAIIYKNLILNLKGTVDGPMAFGGDDNDEAVFLESIKDDRVSLLTYYFSKIQLDYLFGDFEHALAAMDGVRQNLDALMGFMLLAEYIFYDSLVIAAAYNRLNERHKKKYWKTLNKNQRKMKKWSNLCAENFQHKYLLVAAEMARINSGNRDVGLLYDQAIEDARKNGYIQNEALACELAAKYYFSRGRNKIAQAYMIDAYYLYNRWGAVKKTRLLREQYPELLTGIIEQEKSFDSGMLKNNFSTNSLEKRDFIGGQAMDVISKAMQGVSAGEDSQNEALHYLEVAMESAGANKGYLILEKDGDLFIDAARGDEGLDTTGDAPVALEQCVNLSTTVVRYVTRTSEAVVLNDNENPGIFAGDKYIMQHRPKSILCLPVMLRGVPAGVLYLENSLLTGVFTLDKLEILKLLSSQMVYVRKLQSLLETDTALKRDQTSELLSESLTRRELQVLSLVAAGMSNKEIARELQLSTNTVKMHVMNTYGKLGVSRRVQAVIKAKELNLINKNN